MSDEVARILSEMAGVTGLDGPAADTATIDEAAFDEIGYLKLNPDVAESIGRGEFETGFQHFVQHGFREGRRLPGTPMEVRNRLIVPPSPPAPEPGAPAVAAFACEALLVSDTGGVMLLGWVDDTVSPLHLIRVVAPGWRVAMDMTSVARIRRADVETALGKPIVHRFGFIAFLYGAQPIEGGNKASVELWLLNGTQLHVDMPVRLFSEVELRNTLLTRLADADFHGNPAVGRIACLDDGLGARILAFNHAITGRLVASPYFERFGTPARVLRGSIVVCLYGKGEYLHLQNGLFAGLPGAADYEFIYVSNSPELGEQLLREARIGSFVYGVCQTVMVLPGNAGFGAANNAALHAARSDRILNVNPDVFPRMADWAARHSALVEAAPRAQTRLFGVPLYYDDGSLMHAGMYFDADDHISLVGGAFTRRRLLRVEHYGKGAPPDTAELLQARPVPAVTGAFISSDRAWFEKLGGFTEDFVFGHYEDADLCLKSIEAGTPPWLHDIRLWHFEGKGSTRLPPHEGGSAVNRWLFSRRWGEMVENGLLGPSHPSPHGRPRRPIRGGRAMKVLLLSLFHPELVRGGAQQICYELFEGLKAREDIEPVLLCAIEPRFTALYKSGARITGFDNRPNEYVFLNRDYDYLWHKAANPLLIEAYAEFLETVQPDVVHFHHFLLFGLNLLPLTRRVLPKAKLVFTFHEFVSICAADGHMLRRSDKTLCTRASNVRCHQCFPEHGPEHFLTREMWTKRHLSVIDRFTAPSRFMIEHYVTWGLDRDKIDHVTNGQRDYSAGLHQIDERKKRNRFAFFGQMVDNKGVWVLLRAVEHLRAEGFRDFTVEINGDNLRYASPERRKEVEDFLAAEAKLPFAEQNVIFNGSYHVDELPKRMARVDWCVVPSTWWEIFGLVVSEAWMFKRPVIASDVGGPKERIRHDHDGLLFAVGDPRALADTMRRACTEDGLWDRLVAGIVPPASRDVMVDGYLATYAAAEPPAVPAPMPEPASPAGLDLAELPLPAPLTAVGKPQRVIAGRRRV